MRYLVILPIAALLLGAPVAAQQSPARRPAADPVLVFEREVFEYPGSARRDPFQPLTGQNAGPLFDDLQLRMIIFSDDPNDSVVSLVDVSNNHYRVRRGQTVGNATVIDIGPTRVIFSVDDFGMRRQEVLDLKANLEGASR
ncbi:MAG: hypothetical protein WD054_06895 [Gemmatimonadota bacterium]